MSLKKNVEDINSIIQDCFSFNENKYQQENKLKYKSKSPAKGLDYILYNVLNMAEYENQTDDRHIFCNKCGNKVEYTEYGQLVQKAKALLLVE